MNEETRSRCLDHLRQASACLDNTRHAVVAVRLQDVIEAIELEYPARNDTPAAGAKR